MTATNFQNIVSGPDGNINLAQAALLIAAPEYPDLNMDACLQQLDDMATVCRGRLTMPGAQPQALAALGEYLFRDLGFRGDLRTFNDPRNSFLNEVLQRRRGIPITLSLVYLEVGRRIGLTIHGVSFPGHFLVKAAVDGTERIIDPFSGGPILDQAELERRLGHLTTPPEGWNLRRLLAPATNREIIARMLRNLKNIYVNGEDFPRALRIQDMLLMVMPEAPQEVRDRALLHDRLDHFRAAVADYQTYLLLAPDADDSTRVQGRISALRQSMQRLH
ncbi:MAG: tetratricopeptide repeat protein [Gammaproteobacteria bacterium]|nr:tetratricopeptide repeat protein [Gammaproteobacteria bacterium]